MDSKQILAKKEIGDIKTVAEIIGVTIEGTRKILERENAKRHKYAISILKEIIETRENLINQKRAEAEKATA